MIDPRQSYEEKLYALSRAASNGLPLAEIGVGTAVYMAVLGLAVIQDERSRVVITRAGTNRAEPPDRLWA